MKKRKKSSVEYLTQSTKRFCQFSYPINKHQQEKAIWETLYASIDTIEDTQHAIDHYNKLDTFNATSGGYLFVYGLLQALFVQQDTKS